MDILIAGSLGLLIVAILVAIVARRLKLPYTVGLVAAGAGLALSR
ncbi:MAG: sodium:proton antiporter, partial [Proteobacteria bacterium]|nr:sodium:proton antiporter [Pseudomonadota bacterium]